MSDCIDDVCCLSEQWKSEALMAPLFGPLGKIYLLVLSSNILLFICMGNFSKCVKFMSQFKTFEAIDIVSERHAARNCLPLFPGRKIVPYDLTTWFPSSRRDTWWLMLWALLMLSLYKTPSGISSWTDRKKEEVKQNSPWEQEFQQQGNCHFLFVFRLILSSCGIILYWLPLNADAVNKITWII